MPRRRLSPEQYIVIYVKFFRHYRTKRLVFPIPPNTHFRLLIPIGKWKAYQERKAKERKAKAKKNAA